MSNNKKQPLFKSTSKNVETRSMPKSNREETPESYQNPYDRLKNKLKEKTRFL